MSRQKLSLVASTIALLLGGAGDAFAQLNPDVIRQRASGLKLRPELLEFAVPLSPNPWTSLGAEAAEADWDYWNARAYERSMTKAANRPTPSVRVNGRRQRDIRVRNFGTRRGQRSSVQITGEFSLPAPLPFKQAPEDEGSIPLASETGLTAGSALVVNGTIGDGSFGLAGTGSGDFDFYAIRDVRRGERIMVDVDTVAPFDPLDPAVAVYNSLGEIVAFNDDSGGTFDSFVFVAAPEDGDYFVSIGTFGNPILADPFDSSSGGGVEMTFFPQGNEGTYQVTIGLDYISERVVRFNARRGDVVGAALSGTPAFITLEDRTLRERQGSFQNATGFFNTGSPLPTGLASISHVVDLSGRLTLSLLGIQSGEFVVDIAAALPPLALPAEEEQVQTIFIDFDGATVDLAESIFAGFPQPIVVTLSPLTDFLPFWGLTADDEDEVIDAILDRVEESLVDDLARQGRNRRFAIRLLNSRDHADPWGQPNVSRVIVGGTIEELGVSTIGIAQSIDVGNFDTTETGFVLLDLLSGQLPSTIDLNSFPRAPGVSIIDIIAAGVGEITAHEAGHYLGCWHTDQFNDLPNIMDQGGNLEFTILGIGEDGVFGSVDDTNVEFELDVFNPNEGFVGFEDTRTTISFGSTQPL